MRNLNALRQVSCVPLSILNKMVNLTKKQYHAEPRDNAQERLSLALHYLKLPYVGSFRLEATKGLRKLMQRYCTAIGNTLAFSTFKDGRMFIVRILSHSIFVLCINFCVQDVSPVVSTKLRQIQIRQHNVALS